MIRKARDRRGEHYRETDVADVAREVMRAARLYRSDVALFVHPNNTAELCLANGRTFAEIMRRAPASLVGVYGAAIAVEEIAADILAMPRCDLAEGG